MRPDENVSRDPYPGELEFLAKWAHVLQPRPEEPPETLPFVRVS